MATAQWLLLLVTSLAYPAAVALVLAGAAMGVARASLTVSKIALILPVAGLATLTLACHLGMLVPSSAVTRPSHVFLRVAHLNTLFYNGDVTPKIAFIRQTDADIVSLVEANPQLRNAAATLLKSTYPYQIYSGAQGNQGLPMLLLSRWPVQVVQNGGSRQQLYVIEKPGEPLYVLQAHPQSPITPAALQLRNRQLATLSALPLPAAPLVAVGDFNTTPWDSHLNPLRTRLTLAGHWLPTFPRWAPLAPIDQLLSQNLPIPTLQRVRVASTDHLALVADFSN